MRFVLVTYLILLDFELAYSVKINNFEAHTDMNIIHLNIIVPSQMWGTTKKGDGYNHIPGTSTVASSSTEFSKCSKFGVQR